MWLQIIGSIGQFVKWTVSHFSVSPDRKILKINSAILNTEGGVTMHINET